MKKNNFRFVNDPDTPTAPFGPYWSTYFLVFSKPPKQQRGIIWGAPPHPFCNIIFQCCLSSVGPSILIAFTLALGKRLKKKGGGD